MGNQRRKLQTERRRRQRRRITVLFGVALLAIAGVFAYFYFTRDEGSAPAGKSDNAAEFFEGGPRSLVYANFDAAQDLHVLDLGSKDDSILVELPENGETFAAPGSVWVSIVVEGAAAGSGPSLVLFDPTNEEQLDLGTGYDAVWSADGRSVAWLEPEDPTGCKPTSCPGDKTVMVTDVTSGESTSRSEPGAYNVIGWAGDYVMVENEVIENVPVVQTLSPQGEAQDLPIAPREYWGASPDGRFLVRSGETGASFLELDGGRILGDGAAIGIPAGTELGEGAWAPDSSQVVAFALNDEGDLELVSFAPTSPEPVTIAPGGGASTGMSLWSPEGDAIVFQRFNEETGELEAVYCPLDDPAACEVLLSWTVGLSLLRIE